MTLPNTTKQLALLFSVCTALAACAGATDSSEPTADTTSNLSSGLN
jgi:hypothetical protein